MLDLLAKINTLGPPTFFLTLTDNDMHWHEYFMLVDPSLNLERIAQMPSSTKLEILRRHPIQVVMFFEHRLDSFLTNVIMGKIKPLGNVKDY